MKKSDLRRVIFWDMDGVIIDSLGLDLKVVNPLLEERYGEGHAVSRDFLRRKFGLAVPDFCRDVLLEVGQFDQESWAWLHGEYEKLRGTVTFGLCPGVEDRLKEAHERGWKQWIVSNNTERGIEQILNNLNLPDYFDRLWGYDSTGKIVAKPDPRIYLGAFEKAWDRYDGEMDEIYIFEDSTTGVLAATEAKKLWDRCPILVTGVATGGDGVDDLQLADQVLETLEEVGW